MATIESITFEIVSVDKKLGTLLVKYATPSYPEGLVYKVDFPDGEVFDGDALTSFVMQFAPIEQLTDAEAVKEWEDKRSKQFLNADFSKVEMLVKEPVQAIVSGAQTL